MKKQQILIIALVLLLTAAMSYIVVDKMNEQRQQELLSAFQEGQQAGYQQAVVQLLQQAQTCQPVPVTYEDLTLTIIATECLQER